MEWSGWCFKTTSVQQSQTLFAMPKKSLRHFLLVPKRCRNQKKYKHDIEQKPDRYNGLHYAALSASANQCRQCGGKFLATNERHRRDHGVSRPINAGVASDDFRFLSFDPGFERYGAFSFFLRQSLQGQVYTSRPNDSGPALRGPLSLDGFMFRSVSKPCSIGTGCKLDGRRAHCARRYHHAWRCYRDVWGYHHAWGHSAAVHRCSSRCNGSRHMACGESQDQTTSDLNCQALRSAAHHCVGETSLDLTLCGFAPPNSFFSVRFTGSSSVEAALVGTGRLGAD